MKLSDFCAVVCKRFLAIPQVTGVSFDVSNDRLNIKYRVYGCFEGTLDMALMALEDTYVTPYDLVDYMTKQALEFINANGEKEDR